MQQTQCNLARAILDAKSASERESRSEREGGRMTRFGSNPTASPLLSGKAFDLGHNFWSMFCLVAIWVLSQIDQTVCSGLEAKMSFYFRRVCDSRLYG